MGRTGKGEWEGEGAILGEERGENAFINQTATYTHYNYLN